jgi:predicted RNase H-like HicB family nuclease
MDRPFTLEYWLDDGWHVGRLKEIPSIFSQGETLEELEDNIRDAYHMIMAEEKSFTPAVEVKSKELSLSP